jgi:CheY-like chemotaxis protein
MEDEANRSRSCLVAEDELMVAMMLEQTLDELGYDVIGPVSSTTQAMTVIVAAGDALHGAVLDVNLGGEMVYPVAEALDQRGVPFVFVTGYRGAQLEARFAHVPVVQKPYTTGILAPVLARAFRVKRKT